MKQNDVTYIYQNTFSSLLALIKILIDHKIKPMNLKNTDYNPTLLDTIIELELKDEKSFLFWQIKTSKKIINIAYYVFLSNADNKELIIYYFLLNSLKYQEKIIHMRNLKCVDKALKISAYVSHENHKFKGFTRFKELQNHILYATISPENNILPILSKHFQNRLKNENWIIKDEKRQIISIYDKKNFYLVNASNFSLNELQDCQEEKQIAALWKNFYKTISIKERKNERCRNNFMPKKYWKNMLEMSDEIEKDNK